MKRIGSLFVLAIIPLFFCELNARQRTQDEIIRIAQTHFGNSDNPAGTRGDQFEIIPASHLIDVSGDAEAFYLCNTSQNGFVIVSGNDLQPEILGYSSAQLTKENLAPGLLSVLKSYVAMTSFPSNSQVPLSAQQEIDPMIKTAWGQGDPYNRMCPRDGLTRSLTGCVATAAAQVMKYYGFPKKSGTGTKKYITESMRIPVSIDFADYSFAWGQMLDVYQPEKFSSAQGTAVAKLMYAVGAAVEMDYSSQESGSTLAYCTQGLAKYFGYDQDLCAILGETVSSEKWNELLVTELNQSRPVVFTGFDKNTGHAFVLDGYMQKSGQLYYHINWGWSGEGDGYYLVNKLQPVDGNKDLGMGSFDELQIILLNFEPDNGKEDPVYASLYQISLNQTKFGTGKEFGFNLKIDGAFCLLSSEFFGSLVLELVDQNGMTKAEKVIDSLELPADAGKSLDLKNVTFPGLAEGSYTLRPSLRQNNGRKIELLSASPWPLIQIGEEESAISEVRQELSQDMVYDLLGRVKKNADRKTLPAGLYILNNKRFFVGN